MRSISNLLDRAQKGADDITAVLRLCLSWPLSGKLQLKLAIVHYFLISTGGDAIKHISTKVISLSTALTCI